MEWNGDYCGNIIDGYQTTILLIASSLGVIKLINKSQHFMQYKFDYYFSFTDL